MSVLNVRFAEMASGASTPTLASPTRNRASFMGSSGADWSPETETAVNTPFHLTPACSAQDLQRLKEKALEDDFERDLDHAGSFELERLEQSACRLERLSSGRSGEGHGAADIIVVDWLPGDPENPFNWPQHRKYGMILVSCFITFCAAANIGATSTMAKWGTERFGVTREEFILSLTIPMIGIAFTPMALAPLSELYGRNVIYQVTSVITALLFIPQIWSRSFAGLIVSRFFQGCSSSVGISMIGGTIADTFHASDRGLAMNVFALVIFAGNASGPIIAGWTGMLHGIQWCYGVFAIGAVLSCLLNFAILRETRSDVLLARRAKRMTKEAGKRHLCATDLKRKVAFFDSLRISLVRPFQFLLTEPIVTALSTWIGFAWACLFLGLTSVGLVFRGYGFNDGQAGTMQLVVFIGGILGFISNFHQEHLYAKAAARNGGKAPPEARLYWAAFGGLLFPLSLFVFAWTGRPGIHWAVPATFSCLSNWGTYCMYSGIFNYLADAYETYSSSAQASQSFVRNILSAVFPLFAHQMYEKLGYPQASTVAASIGMVLAAAPILLLRYGASLRAKSVVASALTESEKH